MELRSILKGNKRKTCENDGAVEPAKTPSRRFRRSKVVSGARTMGMAMSSRSLSQRARDVADARAKRGMGATAVGMAPRRGVEVDVAMAPRGAVDMDMEAERQLIGEDLAFLGAPVADLLQMGVLSADVQVTLRVASLADLLPASDLDFRVA